MLFFKYLVVLKGVNTKVSPAVFFDNPRSILSKRYSYCYLSWWGASTRIPKRNGLCVTIGIDRRYCPVKVFCFLQNGRRKRKLVTTVVLRQSTSPYKQRTQDVKDEFVTDVGCIRKCVKTEFISQ